MTIAPSGSGIRMTPYQTVVLLICMFLNMLDGYDVFIMGFALPYLPEDFATATMKGYLLSAALVGMGLGAVFGGRIADRFGRRKVLLSGLALNLAGLIVSALAPTYGVLLTARFFTGIAVGAISVVIVVLGQEIVPAARRSVSMGIVMIGFPLGSTLAGLSGSALLSLVGGSWRGMFWVGVGLTTIALLLSVTLVPESVAFLRRVGTAQAIAQADHLEHRFGLDSTAAGSATATAPARPAKGTANLLGRELRSRTLLLWFGYIMVAGSFFFVGTWTPQLIKEATGSAQTGATTGLLVSIGTVLGAVVYAFVGLRLAPIPFAGWAAALSAAAIVGFSLTLPGTVALVIAAALGGFVYATVTGYTATSTVMYPVATRAQGYGAMYGAGRVGAIATPILAGYALNVMTPQAIYLAVVVPLTIAALACVAMFLISRARRTTTGSAETRSDPAAATSTGS